MNTYKVEYTTDNGRTRKTMQVTAADYTKAYLSACYALPFTAIIIELFII